VLIKSFAEVVTKYGVGGLWSAFGKSKLQEASEQKEKEAAANTIKEYKTKTQQNPNYKPTEQEKADLKYARETYKSTQGEQYRGTGTADENNTNYASDYISRPGQPITKFRKDDIIIGGTDPFGEKKASSGGGATPDLAGLFEKLILAQERTIQELQKRQSIYVGASALTEGIGIGSNKIGNT
jgi:hypothetical protein